MGIAGDVRSLLEERAPDAIHRDSSVSIGEPYVLLVDVLIYLNKLGETDELTGRSLYEFIRNVWQKFLVDMCSYVVLLCDYGPNVPVEKVDTQTKRSEQAQASAAKALKDTTPYPEGSKFTDDGVMLPGCEEAQPIEPTRLKASRTTRQALMEFLIEKLTNEVMADGKTILLEYDDEGPIEFSNKGRGKRLTEWKHKHGEAEYSMMFYYNVFRRFPIVVYTYDSDIIPLTVAYLCSTGSINQPKHIIWINNREGWTDLLTMVADVLDNLGWSMKELLLFILFFGTDYVFKNAGVFHQFGARDIFAAFHYCRSEFLDFEKSDGIEPIQLIARYLFSNLQKYGLSRYWDKRLGVKVPMKKRKAEVLDKTGLPFDIPPKLDQVASVDELRTTFVRDNGISKKHIFPSDEAISTCARQIQFNLKYWAHDWIEHHPTLVSDAMDPPQIF